MQGVVTDDGAEGVQGGEDDFGGKEGQGGEEGLEGRGEGGGEEDDRGEVFDRFDDELDVVVQDCVGVKEGQRDSRRGENEGQRGNSLSATCAGGVPCSS